MPWLFLVRVTLQGQKWWCSCLKYSRTSGFFHTQITLAVVAGFHCKRVGSSLDLLPLDFLESFPLRLLRYKNRGRGDGQYLFSQHFSFNARAGWAAYHPVRKHQAAIASSVWPTDDPPRNYYDGLDCNEGPQTHWPDHSSQAGFHAMDGSNPCVEEDKQQYETISEIGHQNCDILFGFSQQ